MEKFWEYMGESILVQALITVVLVLTICYLFLAGREVPDLLGALCGTVLGFWFGTKTQHSLEKRAREVE